MILNADPGLPKKYYRLKELSEAWHLEVSELLNYAIEGILHVAVEDFSGPVEDELLDDDSSPTDSEADVEYPRWALFPVSDVLKRLALHGTDTIGGGYRVCASGLVPVFLRQPRIISVDDLVVPIQALGSFVNSSLPAQGPDTPITKVGRETLLKQIAGLAVLLSKQQDQLAWGKKPNSLRIAEAIEKAIATWPTEKWGELEKDFFSKSKVNDSIREGLVLIGFKKEDEPE